MSCWELPETDKLSQQGTSISRNWGFVRVIDSCMTNVPYCSHLHLAVSKSIETVRASRHIFKRNSFRSIWDKARVGMTKSSEVPFQSWHFSQHLDEGAQQKSAPSRRWGAMGRWMVGVFNSRRQTGREGRGHWHCEQVMERGHMLTSVFCAFGLGREKKTVNHYIIRSHHVTSGPPLLNMQIMQKAPRPWLSNVHFFFQV